MHLRIAQEDTAGFSYGLRRARLPIFVEERLALARKSGWYIHTVHICHWVGWWSGRH